MNYYYKYDQNGVIVAQTKSLSDINGVYVDLKLDYQNSKIVVISKNKDGHLTKWQIAKYPQVIADEVEEIKIKTREMSVNQLDIVEQLVEVQYEVATIKLGGK